MELPQDSDVNGVAFLGASNLDRRLKDGMIIY
jgi:hypothetical protein